MITTLKPKTNAACVALLPDRFHSEAELKDYITDMKGRLAEIAAALNVMERALRLEMPISKAKAKALLAEQRTRETALFWLQRTLEEQQPAQAEPATTQATLGVLLEAAAQVQAKVDALTGVAIATRSTTAVTLGLLRPQTLKVAPQFSPRRAPPRSPAHPNGGRKPYGSSYTNLP
ncbi:MAG: hypothetical protein F6J95_023420 [Leptolyngbya sp. SIO1E4]|nr:hypothetical protein [Leptolyngbya sp. SIO1E4]